MWIEEMLRLKMTLGVLKWVAVLCTGSSAKLLICFDADSTEKIDDSRSFVYCVC
jgi:hypothetical protein